MSFFLKSSSKRDDFLVRFHVDGVFREYLEEEMDASLEIQAGFELGLRGISEEDRKAQDGDRRYDFPLQSFFHVTSILG